MKEPFWLSLNTVEDIHGEQLVLFGGPEGIRDRGALDSALARPINRWHYGCMDFAELAAAYAFGIARNHPFVDGNKRAAFAALIVFLRLNGLSFTPSQADATAIMLEVASGEIDEAGLTRWIADNLPDGK
ncbi:MAG: type II toxin-antitoxin system death-on-curing family toxin [Alphaproteobacteria bacterium]